LPVIFLECSEAAKSSGVFDSAAGFEDCGDPSVSLDSVVNPLADLVEQTQE
jgi:hypothetical protein